MSSPRKLKEPNPLNFYGIRQVRVPPPYFESISLELSRYNLEQTIIKWITENLKGRFYVGSITELNKSNQYVMLLKVAFEDPKELSFFTLACPHLKYK